jgi:D-arabinose 1-dehydrogenase-like Zn-dependent alcohol dehydrogenase
VRAAVLRSFGEPLEVTEVPEPAPAENEVVIRVRATGVCGTDLKLVAGELEGTRLPIIPGHEVAGELVGRVEGLEPRQRVACYIYESCGECRVCRAGQRSICPYLRRIGLERDGGLAEYLTLPRENLIPFSASLSFEAAAVAMDAVTTPWHALASRARVTPGESVAVVGAGGLGLNAVQIAGHMGASVAVVEPDIQHRELALRLGAELAIPPGEVQAIVDWADGGVDVALDASGVRAGFDVAAAAVRRGGRIVVLGYRPGVEYGLDSARLALEEITVLGSRLGPQEAAREALRAVEAGTIRPAIAEVLGLEDANRALDILRAGSAVGRLVIQPQERA